MSQDSVGGAAKQCAVLGIAGEDAVVADVGVGEPDGVLAAFNAAGAAVGLLVANVDGLEGGDGGEEEGYESESCEKHGDGLGMG